MYASEVKKVTVERQYDYVMRLIEKYMGNEDVESKIPVDVCTLCDDTIDILLTDGFDVIKITDDDNDGKAIMYEISWENSAENKKGEFKHVNISENFQNSIMPFLEKIFKIYFQNCLAIVIIVRTTMIPQKMMKDLNVIVKL
jgi:hypothetical protein